MLHRMLVTCIGNSMPISLHKSAHHVSMSRSWSREHKTPTNDAQKHWANDGQKHWANGGQKHRANDGQKHPHIRYHSQRFVALTWCAT